MKKLFTLAVASVLTALSMNAASIYLMGDGEGLTWDQFPGKEVAEGSDGYYTVTINNLNSFKVSTNKSTGWDGSGNFNEGAYQLASGSFDDAVANIGGQTLNLTKGSTNNIDTPWAGAYTVKIKKDLSTINLYTTTPKPTEAPDAYLVGQMNSWGINSTYKFNVSTQGSSYVYTLDCSIPANSNFKIAGANGTAVNWGGAINYGTGTTIAASQMDGSEISIPYNGNDMKVAVAFNGTVKLTIPKTAKQAGKISFTQSGTEVTYPSTMYVLGNVNGKGWDPTNGYAMTATANKGEFTAEVAIGNELEVGYGYFSFTESLSTSSSDWNGLGTRYGATENDFAPSFTTANEITVGENSFKVEADHTYKMTLNLEKSTLMIAQLASPDTPDPDPTPGETESFEASFDFTTVEDIAKVFPGIPAKSNWDKDGSNPYYVLNDQKLVSGNITVTTDKGTSTSAGNVPKFYEVTSSSKMNIRMYSGNTITISVPDGSYFTEIVFGTNGLNSQISKIALVDGQPGTITNNSTDKTMTWTPGSANASSVSFTTTGTIYLATIDVKGEVSEGKDEPIDPDPDPTPDISSVYVVGGGYTWDLPGTEVKGTDGVFTFKVNGKFKVSTVNSTDWDEYNEGAYATGAKTFGDAVTNAGGQTLPVEIWGEDQELPWDAEYTITLNLKDMTMNAYTATTKPVAAPDVYVRGDMNNWLNGGLSDTWKFTNVSWDATAQTGVFTLDCSIPAGQAFKIADATWGSINYGGVQGIKLNEETTLKYNDGTNLTLGEAFEGTITFTITASKDSATILFTQEGEVKDPEAFYVVGTLASQNGNFTPNNGVKMTSNGDGTYTANEVALQANNEGWCGFAIAANLGANDNDWGTLNGLRFGPATNDTPAVIGTNSDIATGDLSWSFDAGTYKMVFDYKNLTLTISEADGDGIEAIGADNAKAVYYNLQGVEVKNPEKGIFIKVVGKKAEKVVR